MKKLLKIFLGIIFLMFIPIVANATCDNSVSGDCAYCVYDYKPRAGCGIKLKVTYKSSISSIIYDYEKSSSFSSALNITCSYSYNNFAGKDFKDASGKIICPKVNISSDPQTFKVTIAPDKYGTTSATSESKIVSNPENQNEPTQKTIVCNYSNSECGGFTVRAVSNQTSITLKTTGYQISSNLKASYFTSNNCPNVYVLKNNNTCYFENKLINQSYKKATGESIDPETGASPLPPSDSKQEVTELAGCSSLLGDPSVSNPATPAYYLSFAFSIMRYAAIILLIGMTIMDFVGALAAQDNDVMRKSISKLGKRAIMCVIIFLLPTLIDFVLQFLHQSQVSDCIDLSK